MTDAHRPEQLIDRSVREKIVLVGVVGKGDTPEQVDADLDELEQLVDTAGADVHARVVQRKDKPDASTFIGSGKAEELHELSLAIDADTVVFDDELSPAQQRNLEKILGRTAIDRTAVILDIFAQNARTQEGRDQVELALLRYRLPRMRGRRTGLDQQRGGTGIGNRGLGETKLEVDRRRMLERITRLERNLSELGRTRRNQRKQRGRARIRSVSLVGYTNAGKSTLLNRLTDAGVLVENRLFATLDPRTRRLDMPGGESLLLSDTVGFVKKLPHQLVAAFKSTLEVVAESDLLVHVVDASAADPMAQMAAVREVLDEIGAGTVPDLIVVNKADAAPDVAASLVAHHPGAVMCSALTGAGASTVLAAIGDRLRALAVITELLIPWERGDAIASVHREGEVLSEVHDTDGVRIRARLEPASLGQLRDFVVLPSTPGSLATA